MSTLTDKLIDFEIAANECRNVQELGLEFQKLVSQYGAAASNANVIVGADKYLDRGFGCYPEAWTQRYQEQNYVGQDPVLSSIRRYGTVGYWEEHLKRADISKSGAQVMGEAADFGLKDGYTRPVRALNGSVFLLCLYGERLDHSKEAQAIFRMAGNVFVEEGARLISKMKITGTGPDLTSRQQEILKLRSNGWPYKEIAAEVGISPRTVEVHIRDARERLGAKSTSEAIKMATERRLLG